MKKHLRLFWAIPLTFFLFFLTISFIPKSSRIPEFRNLGNASKINIVVPSDKNAFYIANGFSIEGSYSNIISNLKFTVYDSQGRETKIKSDLDFFYSGDIDGTHLSAGSVFHLPRDLAYPFNGYLESNIADFGNVVWVQSNGSFVMSIILFVILFVMSILIVFFSLVRKQHQIAKEINPR